MAELPIELELRKLGLNEKEVAAYLAGLELGPTSVQNIAKKAKISRPTTYLVIKKLKEKGFFEEISQKKKKYYLAQSPDSILSILRIKKREIEEKEREFIRIIAALEAKYSKEKGGIKEYKGKKGLEILKERFSFTSTPLIFVLSSENSLKEIKKREEIYQKIKKRLGEIEVKEICSKKFSFRSPKWLKRKFFSRAIFKGTLILCDKIIFFPSQRAGLLIENKLLLNLFICLFLDFWNFLNKKGA